MPAYTYRCRECDSERVVIASVHQDRPTPVCHGVMARDYRADAAQIHSSATPSKQGGRYGEGGRVGDADNPASMMLPTAEDFKTPQDPDGLKGLRQWNEEHEPRESNPEARGGKGARPGYNEGLGREMRKYR